MDLYKKAHYFKYYDAFYKFPNLIKKTFVSIMHNYD